MFKRRFQAPSIVPVRLLSYLAGAGCVVLLMSLLYSSCAPLPHPLAYQLLVSHLVLCLAAGDAWHNPSLRTHWGTRG